jgi:Flp pilus assembly protein TadD
VLGVFVAFPTPSAAQGQIRPGDLLLADGRFEEAAAEYRTWLRAHGQDAAAHNRLGLCLQKTAQPKQARREYQRAVEADRC